MNDATKEISNLRPMLKTWDMLAKSQQNDIDYLKTTLNAMVAWEESGETLTAGQQRCMAKLKDQIESIESGPDESDNNGTLRVGDFSTEANNIYYSYTLKGIDEIQITHVADFSIELVRREVSLDGRNELFILKFDTGRRVVEKEVEAANMSDVSVFRRLYCGGDFNFHGNTADLLRYNSEVLREAEVLTLFNVDQVGMYKHPETEHWIYVNYGGVYDKDGNEIEDVVLKQSVKDELPDIMKSKIKPDKSAKPDIGTLLFEFNSKTVLTRFLGWTAATFFKQRLKHINDRFPILSPLGASGSGKTSSIDVLLKIWGITGCDISNFYLSTPFVRQKTHTYSNLIPAIWDEIKPGNDVRKIEKWETIVNGIYTSQKGGKGTKNQTIIYYTQDCPLVGLSEYTVGSQAVKDRCLYVDFNIKVSKKHREGWDSINGRDLSSIGSGLLYRAMNVTDEEIESIVDELHNKILSKSTLRDRPAWNITIACFGLYMLGEVINLDVKKGIDTLMEYVETGSREEEEDNISYALQVVERFKEMMRIEGQLDGEGKKYAHNYHLEEKTHYYIKDDELRLRVNKIWGVYGAWCNTSNLDPLLSAADFKKQIKNENMFIANKQADFGGKSHQALVLKYQSDEGIETKNNIIEMEDHPLLSIGLLN